MQSTAQDVMDQKEKTKKKTKKSTIKCVIKAEAGLVGVVC